ncbi:MAG TPA: lipoyl synthase [Candidatus Binatia bacterium]|nr:lipoyl synthase [Candidatus Binatia bacterium]
MSESSAPAAAGDASPSPRRHPEWIRVRVPGGPGYARTRRIVKESGVATVCEEARCPNVAECWAHGTATFMLMGDTCTRNCGFCAVSHGKPKPLDPLEPERLAHAVAELGLRHVVLTSVDRDDLPDFGAAHFAAAARAVRRRVPACEIEVLTPDFQGARASVATVAAAPIAVYNHNLETVPRLYKRARAGARYERSLDVLRWAREERPELVTKAGLMLGLGERTDEVLAVLRDLRAAGCDVVTIGQYLRPSRDHLPVERYLHPSEFEELGHAARALGFRHVESGPLVRSSYHAWSHLNEGIFPSP